MANKIKVHPTTLALLDHAAMQLRDLIQAGDGTDQVRLALKALQLVLPSFEALPVEPTWSPCPSETA